MAREPELSIKVKVDPQIDAAKLQEDINKKIPKDGVEIKGKLNAKELLKSISAYQEGGQNLVPLLAKISNVDEALKAFENKETETKVSLKATQASLDTIRNQLQGVIDGLDYSKLEGASAPALTSSIRRTKKGKKTATVDASTAAKQEIPVDVVGTISDDSITALKAKIETGLNDVAIVANIAPDQLSKIRKDVEAAFNGIAITPTVKGVNGAAAQTGAKKKINIPSDDKIMEQMANAQYATTKNENAEAAAVKQKNIIYQNLADHQAKASENASAATAKTAQGLSDANKAMGDLNAAAVDFEQDWRRVVTLITSATKNLANLMKDKYGGSSGLDIFSSFQEFQKELPVLDTEHVKSYMDSIKDWSNSLLGSAKGDFDPNTMIQAIHMLSGLADAWNHIDVSKLTDNQTKDKLLKEMSELNSIFPSSGDKEPFLGEKDAAINYLTDLLAKAAKYYAEVGNAAKQTADSIAVANEGFANQTAELEKNNTELEKLERNERITTTGNQADTQIPLPTNSKYTAPEDTLDDYLESIGAAAGLQEYFAKEIDNVNAELGKQTEALNGAKKSLDEYYLSLSNGSNPVDIKGKITISDVDITVPDKITINGEVIVTDVNGQNGNNGTQKPNNNPPPNPQPPNPRPNNGGNNTPPNNGNPPSQKSLEDKLAKILNEIMKLENTQDTSSDKNYQKNVLTQIKRKGQLWNRADDIEKELDANYPGWSTGKS